MKECRSLEAVRSQIDDVDRRIIALIAERGEHVKQAIRYKTSAADIPSPARVAQVMAKANMLAMELGANRWVVEQVYRAMTSAFIAVETEAFKDKEKA